MTILRSEVVGIMSGTIFLLIGLVACAAACAFAAVRRESGVRLFAWLGVWSAMYGALLLADAPSVVAALPHQARNGLPFLTMAIDYFFLTVVALAWLELSAGKMRVFLKTVIGLGLAFGIAGVGFFVVTGSSEKLLSYVHFIAVAALLIFVVILAVPGLSRKYLILPNRAVMVVGTLVFATDALYFNLARLFHYQAYRITGSVGLAALLFSFGYVGVQIALSGERRLHSIESELAIAQEIQASILPGKNPEVKNLLVAAAYRPMTAVAGDFYDFIAVDENRVGFLVADVKVNKTITNVPGHSYAVPYAYYRSFYGYYGTVYQQVYTPGYLREDTAVRVETNFYSATPPNEELIWTGTSDSFNPKSAQKAIDGIVKLIVKELKKQSVL